MKEVIRAAGVDTSELVSHHRHGVFRAGIRRVLKMHLSSKEVCDRIRRNADVRQLLKEGAFIRQDYTENQLRIDRQLRKECYERSLD